MVPSSRPRADRGGSPAGGGPDLPGRAAGDRGRWRRPDLGRLGPVDRLRRGDRDSGGTSINGKGAIAETSACAIGVVGNNGARSYANAWIAEADLILFIGTRTDSTTTVGWTLPPKSSPPVTIHLDVSSREIGNNYPSSAFLQGDAAVTLEELLAAIDHPETLRAAECGTTGRLTDERDAYFVAGRRDGRERQPADQAAAADRRRCARCSTTRR